MKTALWEPFIKYVCDGDTRNEQNNKSIQIN